MSSPSYDPAERQYVLATLALIVVLTVFGIVVLAATPGETQPASSGPGSPDAGSPGGAPAATAPDNLAFLCDNISTVSSAENTDITTAQRDAAQSAAKEYVRAAYGYRGSDGDAYRAGVDRLTVKDCIDQSPASDEIDNMSEAVRQGGAANTAGDSYYYAAFVEFDITSTERVKHDSGTEYLRVSGTAVWVSRPSGGGALVGRMQDLTLVKQVDKGPWRVSWGELVNPNTDFSSYKHAVRDKIEELGGRTN